LNEERLGWMEGGGRWERGREKYLVSPISTIFSKFKIDLK